MLSGYEIELEHIKRGLAKRVAKRQELWDTNPDAPHPHCDCGRNWLAHLDDEIEGLTYLVELIEDENPDNLMNKLLKQGPTFIIFILSHVFSIEDMEYVEILGRQAAFLRKLKAFLAINLLPSLINRMRDNLPPGYPPFDPRMN